MAIMTIVNACEFTTTRLCVCLKTDIALLHFVLFALAVHCLQMIFQDMQVCDAYRL